jgi:hypothetical protein
MANTAVKPKTEPRTLVAFVARMLQIAFCVVCLAVAANWSKTWGPFKGKSWQVHIMLQSVNLAIFASVTGFFSSLFFLLAPRLAPSVADDLPGLIDMLVSTISSVFFLSAGASLLSWGACKSDSLCLSWNGTIGVCFFLWILYSITAVVAGLDLRAQIQALKGVPPGTPTPGTPTKAGQSGSKPGTPTRVQSSSKLTANGTAAAQAGAEAV